ncbi:MAG: erythromycin esterase family protein [Gemmatimonadota bacterium]
MHLATPMRFMARPPLTDLIARVERPLRDDHDLDALLDRVGERRIVLLGEASHGTSEYYEWRTRISQRLVREKQFSFIAVEGDWPDCYHLNRYVKQYPDAGSSAYDVAHAFARWPTWLWANEEVIALAEWLRRHNHDLPRAERVGFYGLDVYSLWESIEAVVRYLERVDPDAAGRARRAYACFDPYHQDVHAYARATALVPTSCEAETLRILIELRRNAPQYKEDGRDAYFNAEQNAMVALNAERYYRAMMLSGPDSWNLRDTHMIETLQRLLNHYGPGAKAIVWEHNTHVGDARATDMQRAGMVNVGQLARERWREDDVYIVGFASYRGSVIAGEEWGAEMARMPVPPAKGGSWEDLLHQAGANDKMLFSNELNGADADRQRGQRAIGVVYDPAWERAGNYVPTVMPRRYDALLYVDESHALHPLHMPVRIDGEPPETYPSGM